MKQNRAKEWSKEFSVDNLELDLHHMKIIGLAAELSEEEATLFPQKYAKILSELMDCFMIHFKCEEEYMAKHSYPFLEQHKEKHDMFIFLLSLFNLDFNQEIPTKANELHQLITEWLFDHELKMDCMYRDFIKKKLRHNIVL